MRERDGPPTTGGVNTYVLRITLTVSVEGPPFEGL